MRKKILFLVIVGLMLTLVGCSLSAEEQMQAAFYATQYALDPVNNIPPAHYQTLAAQHGYYIPVVPSTPTPNQNWTPTMSFYEFSGTQVAQQQNISMTNQANQVQIEQARLAAEERARQEAEEARSAQETAVAYSQQQTAEARVFFANQTAAAQGTAMMATAQAQATATMWQFQLDQGSTAVAAAATNQVLPTHAVWTQDAVYAIQTVEQGNADKVALAVKRQETKNMLDALLPWALVVIALYVLGKGLFKWLRQRTHARDEHGRQPLLTMEDDAGNVKIIKPETMGKSMVSIAPDGKVTAYDLVSEQEQSDLNRRAQAVDALAVLPSPYAQQGTKIMNTEFGRGGAPRVNMSSGPSADMRPVLDEADSKLIEED